MDRNILVFHLDGAAYGLDAALVRKTVWLPALAPAAAAPAGIIGLFNLRGAIVPVLDLSLRLGRGPHRRRASDQVVVLAAASPLGIVVSEVRDLAPWPPGGLLPLPPFETGDSALALGSLQLGDDLVTVLDGQALALALGDAAGIEAPAGEEEAGQAATPAEAALYRARARRLRQPLVPETPGQLALAVVELAGQHFGIELRTVREFCRVARLCPLPCSPPHVAGVFNLRGHLVTLLEVAGALGLPPPRAPRAMAVIGSLGEEAVGIAVDDILDVFNPGEADLEPLPPAIARQHGGEVRTTATFAGRRVTVLDLPALLRLDRWAVNETVV